MRHPTDEQLESLELRGIKLSPTDIDELSMTYENSRVRGLDILMPKD